MFVTDRDDRLARAVLSLYATESDACYELNRASRNGDFNSVEALGPFAFFLGMIIQNNASLIDKSFRISDT